MDICVNILIKYTEIYLFSIARKMNQKGRFVASLQLGVVVPGSAALALLLW